MSVVANFNYRLCFLQTIDEDNNQISTVRTAISLKSVLFVNVTNINSALNEGVLTTQKILGLGQKVLGWWTFGHFRVNITQKLSHT